MIRVITIEREYGSGGNEIAEQLAERLGWKLWDQFLTDEIARLMDCDSRAVEEREERRDPLYYRLFKAFMRGSFEGSLNAPRLKLVDADCIKDLSEQLVIRAYNEGQAVIVGRGSAYHLQNRAEAFHVFTYAPFDEKVQRLCQGGKTDQNATELVETVDRDRAAFIKEQFGVEWPTRHFFHLMVNTAMGVDAAVEVILSAVTAVEKQASSSHEASRQRV
jgi:cytidylate kinase